jgi:hypothetical protein
MKNQKPSQAETNSNSIADEMCLRLLIWTIFVSGSEKLADNFLRQHVPANHMYYIVLIAFSCGLFFLISLCGRSDIIQDMRELAFYDILVQIFGLWMQFYWYKPELYLMLNCAVWLAKLLRLLWFAKSSDGVHFVGWPVFGVIGYLASKKNGITRQVVGGRRQNAICYLFLLLTIPVGFAYKYQIIADATERLMVVPFILSVYYSIVWVKQRSRERSEDAEAKRKLVEANEQLQGDAELLKGMSSDARELIMHYPNLDDVTRKAIARIAQVHTRSDDTDKLGLRMVWNGGSVVNNKAANMPYGYEKVAEI